MSAGGCLVHYHSNKAAPIISPSGVTREICSPQQWCPSRALLILLYNCTVRCFCSYSTRVEKKKAPSQYSTASRKYRRQDERMTTVVCPPCLHWLFCITDKVPNILISCVGDKQRNESEGQAGRIRYPAVLNSRQAGSTRVLCFEFPNA